MLITGLNDQGLSRSKNPGFSFWKYVFTILLKAQSINQSSYIGQNSELKMKTGPCSTCLLNPNFQLIPDIGMKISYNPSLT